MRTFLRALSKPWLGRLIQQRIVCQALLVLMSVLGFGVWVGWSLWPCVFANVTGLPCPGCGMTRSLAAWLRGDVHEALRFHPLSPFLILIGGFVAAGALFPQEKTEALASRITRLEEKSRGTFLFLLLLITFSLMRILGFWYQPSLSRSSLFPLLRQKADLRDNSHHHPNNNIH